MVSVTYDEETIRSRLSYLFAVTPVRMVLHALLHKQGQEDFIEYVIRVLQNKRVEETTPLGAPVTLITSLIPARMVKNEHKRCKVCKTPPGDTCVCLKLMFGDY